MAVNAGKILIVGCGPGATEYVSPAARGAAGSADVLLGAQRLLDLFPECVCRRIAWHGPVEELLAKVANLVETGLRPAVLVSGDPGVFSVARRIVERFGSSACRIVPAVSSVQVAFARLGLEWIDARIISAHGRTPDVQPGQLAGCDKIAILAGTAEAIAWCAHAAATLQQTHAAFVCEELTLPDERVRRLEADEIAACQAASLTLVLLIRKEMVS
jgi:precorrin-6y C5,15-methyltransferase (decarboxylating) CbiE subunit